MKKRLPRKQKKKWKKTWLRLGVLSRKDKKGLAFACKIIAKHKEQFEINIKRFFEPKVENENRPWINTTYLAPFPYRGRDEKYNII